MRDMPNLDLMRSCAALSVVLEHLLLAFNRQTIGPLKTEWIGVVGVLLFFVHTSLVLMWSLERKPFTLDFYVRRVFRIYPLAIVAILIVWATHAPVDGTPLHYFVYMPPPAQRRYLLTGFLLIPNIVAGYMPLSVLWSLPYEIEMYLLLPMLFAYVRHQRTLWPVLLLWVASVALNWTAFPFDGHNFFLCVPYFLPGVLAYVGFSRRRPTLPAWSFLPFLFLLWATLVYAFSWRRGDVFCLAVGLGLPLFRQISLAWLCRAARVVARYSYGIYLMHPFAIVLGLYRLHGWPWPVQVAVTLLSSALLAWLAYHLVEKPMMRLGSSLATRLERHAIAAGALIPDHPIP